MAPNQYVGTEKRKHARYPWDCDIEIAAGGATGTGRVHNISMGGALIAADLPLELESVITIKLCLPGIKEPSQLKCTVRWFSANGEAGLHFHQLRAIETKSLSQLVLSLAK